MTSSSNQDLVTLTHVDKSFKDQKVVADLCLNLRQGRILGLLGHNGAGKTTTIRMILNLIAPDSGSIEVLGQSVTPAVKDKIGYLPEERGLYQKMKVLDLLSFMGELNGMAAGKAKAEARHWLEKLELWDRKEAKVEDFSKGMQQKVQWIAAMIHRPPLLILDEPFSGLDPVNTQRFEEMIRDLRNSGTGIIFSTHVLEQAERLLDDVVMLKHGVSVVQGNLDRVKSQFGRDWVQIKGPGCAEALAKVKGIGQPRPFGKSLRVRMEGATQPREVLEQLLGLGAEIEEFRLAEPTLKEIFLHKVGGIDWETLNQPENHQEVAA